jgi:hypothetical protein
MGQVDPARQRQTVLVGKRLDLAGLDRVRRRHGAADEVQVGPIAIGRRVRDRLAPEL